MQEGAAGPAAPLPSSHGPSGFTPASSQLSIAVPILPSPCHPVLITPTCPATPTPQYHKEAPTSTSGHLCVSHSQTRLLVDKICSPTSPTVVNPRDSHLQARPKSSSPPGQGNSAPKWAGTSPGPGHSGCRSSPTPPPHRVLLSLTAAGWGVGTHRLG